MRTLRILPFISIVLAAAGCATPGHTTPPPPTATAAATASSFDPSPLAVEQGDPLTAESVALEWTRRWWTTPNPAERPAAVRTLSTPTFFATLTMTHPSDNPPPPCNSLSELRTYLGHASQTEVTVTGLCRTPTHVDARATTLVITISDGQTLVDGVR